MLIMGQKFHTASPWKHLKYDYAAMAVVYQNMIVSPKACVLIHEKGMLGGNIEPVYFDPSAIFARVMFWLAEDGGKPLLIEFEKWADNAGASSICTAAPYYPDQKKNTKFRKLYARMGYEPSERYFVRNL